MTDDKFIVDEFIKDPETVSLFAPQRIHWANFLALLHLLLIKHGKKKFHMVSHHESYSKRICKLAHKLELKWKLVNGTQLFEYHTQGVPLPQNVLTALTESKCDGENIAGIVIAKDENDLNNLEGSVLSDSNVGKIIEYPDCCVNWYVNNKSSGWEEVYAFVIGHDINKTDSPIEDIVNTMTECYEDHYIPASKIRMHKIHVNHIGESRVTMPFIFFQPCDVCIGPSSPARKLNEKYENFAKLNYPQLYKKIIDEAKIDAKQWK